jgi:hypothetical protein
MKTHLEIKTLPPLFSPCLLFARTSTIDATTNLLARDLMSAQPGTHQTNPDPRGIAKTTANDAADE